MKLYVEALSGFRRAKADRWVHADVSTDLPLFLSGPLVQQTARSDILIVIFFFCAAVGTVVPNLILATIFVLTHRHHPQQNCDLSCSNQLLLKY